MFQDIKARLIWEERRPGSGDRAVIVKDGTVLAGEKGQLPPMDVLTDEDLRPRYLLTMKQEDAEETSYFYISEAVLEEKGLLSGAVLQMPARDMRSESAAALQTLSGTEAEEERTDGEKVFAFRHPMGLYRHEGIDANFAAATAMHLAKWYDDNRLCGHCGSVMEAVGDERALECAGCGRRIYPAIAPVVIVGVTRGDEILLTRYASANGYRRHALIAGFVEVGETLERAIEREVYEEAGLKVHHIRYFASQPWAFSQSLLSGFFCDADEGSEISLNTDGKEELAEAVWVRREDIEPEDNTFSLTWTMIRAFKEGLC